MTFHRYLGALAILLVSLLPACLGAESRPASEISIGPEGGRLLALSIDGTRIPLPSQGGGFRAYDATARQDIPIRAGSAKQANGGAAFEAQGGGIRLRATFALRKGFVLVQGELENTRQDERGVILDYCIPPLSADAVLSNGLDHAASLAGPEEYEGNTFPIAALCGNGAGVALAIPPSQPRVFGMAGNGRGMSVRFYLGMSPQTQRFPNRAPFVFMIYPVDVAWGFRSALAQYYAFFPDYYTPRLKRDGLFMFQMEDRVPANVDQYGFNMVESQWKAEILERAIARDEKHGISTFPYSIVGQREIKFLPSIPKDYDEAMAVYARWSLADQAGHEVTKENSASQGDIHLKEEVEASACQTSDGKYAIVLRNTPWGGNSISFKINPSPDLFKDENRPTVASYAFELMQKWLKEHPQYDAMFVDSLGANWPALLNYRKDHFKYARYPLTFDPQGRLALQNDLSHYEYVETLRAWMRSVDRLVAANGVYAYKSKGAPVKRAPAKRVERQVLDKQLNEYRAEGVPPEHYRAGAKLGRFFCAALLDVASSEAGVLANVERCQDVRVFMGRKHYAYLNYAWEDGAKIEEFVNKSLCYGIFASTSTNFFSGVQYENHPNGYLRDKKLLDWYVPLVRMLSRAGWEPVRYGAVDAKAVLCERFGSGDAVYYAIYNDAETKTTCTLQVDLKGLGLAGGRPTFQEIARKTTLAQPTAHSVTLELQPKRACIIQVARRD